MFYLINCFVDPVVIEDRYVLGELVVADDAVFLPDENVDWTCKSSVFRITYLLHGAESFLRS